MTPRLYTEWDDNTIINFLKDTAVRHNPRTVKNSKPKWTEEEKTIRRWFILDLFRRGQSKIKINHLLQTSLEISYSTANKYIKDALEYLTESNEETIENMRNTARERLEGIIQTCVETHRMKEAISALDQLNKINGLYVQNVEVKADTTMTFNFGE